MASDLSGVMRYLEAVVIEKKAAAAFPLGSAPFVTISRQAGAGGRSLAEALMRRMRSRTDEALWLDWHVFDRDLCEKVVQDPRIRSSLRSLLTEEVRGPLEDILLTLIAGSPPELRVYNAVFETISQLAALGKAVIVGRGGACLTRRFAGGAHVRLIGSKDARVARAAGRVGFGPDEARRWVEEQDKHRAQLVRRYFHRDIEDPLLYDCVWNTDTVSFDGIADAVLALVEARAGLECRA